MKRWVGVDLHKNNFVVCWMEESGESRIETYQVNGKGLQAFKRELSLKDEVAIESTGNAGFLAREVEDRVAKVRLINPLQFKVISTSVKKTDEQDAATIARYLSKGLIPEVRMRSKEEAQLASLIGTRDKLVKLRSALKNKIHNILNAQGIVTAREVFSSEKGLEKVSGLKVEEVCKLELRVIVEQIRSLNKSIDEIGEALKDKGKDLPGHKNLTSITGIGDISAAILLNTIGDIKDFDDDRKLAAYFGIVPRMHQSNQTCHYGRITKMGNKIARTALVQSTLIAIKYSPYLRNFYMKLKGKKGSGRAIIATARKLLTIIYRTLKNNWVFEDFNKYQLAATV